MAKEFRLNFNNEVKEAAKQLGIEGYRKLQLHSGVRAYISANEELVRVAVVNTKLNAIRKCVPIFILDFDKSFFKYKDTKHIVDSFEKLAPDELTVEMSTVLDVIFTICYNELIFGTMCGHTFDVDKNLKSDSMICIHKTPVQDKLVEFLVCEVYPITKKELDTLSKLSAEDRFYIVADVIKSRKFGDSIDTYCDFSVAEGISGVADNAIKHSEEITERAANISKESGGFRVENGNVHIETEKQFDKLMEVIKDLE